MQEDKIKLLEQLDIVLHLQNTSIGYLVANEGDYYDYDEDPLATLGAIHSLRQREADPDESFKIALQIDEMGVTPRDLHDYAEYLIDIENQKYRERAYKNVVESKVWKKLEECKFFRTTSKQYPKHFHFTFTMPNGIQVSARLFRKAWANYRVTYKWTDSLGKKQSATIRLNTYKIHFDSDWPTSEDMEYYDFDDSREQFARYIAYALIKKSPRSRVGKTLNLVYPA
jgi:hypothetical protein